MYIFSKISLLVASVTILTAFAAEILSILDKKYSTIIITIAAVVQLALLLLVMVAIMIKRRNINGVKMTRYHFNDRFIKGGDYILPGYISTTNPRKFAIFKILLEIKNIEEPPEIAISKNGVASVTQDMGGHIVNINSGIVEDSFMFDADVIVKPGEGINLKLKKDTLIKSFFLGEFYIP